MLTRLFAPAADRKVTRLDVPGLPEFVTEEEATLAPAQSRPRCCVKMLFEA